MRTANLALLFMIPFAAQAAGPTPAHTAPNTTERRKACCARMVGHWDTRTSVDGWCRKIGGRWDQTFYNTCVALP